VPKGTQLPFHWEQVVSKEESFISVQYPLHPYWSDPIDITRLGMFQVHFNLSEQKSKGVFDRLKTKKKSKSGDFVSNQSKSMMRSVRSLNSSEVSRIDESSYETHHESELKWNQNSVEFSSNSKDENEENLPTEDTMPAVTRKDSKHLSHLFSIVSQNTSSRFLSKKLSLIRLERNQKRQKREK